MMVTVEEGHHGGNSGSMNGEDFWKVKNNSGRHSSGWSEDDGRSGSGPSCWIEVVVGKRTESTGGVVQPFKP